MSPTLEHLAVKIYSMPEGLEVAGVVIEHGGTAFEVRLPMSEEEPLPVPEGSFRITIDVVPRRA